ncbi:MAG: type 1 glutamine amidotransferase [Alphaproteobacteria bacterium]|nr:type 1 glutamine amidotransferase [Alphaproteobacteria bacterium]
MKIGILETGRLPRRLAAYGAFDGMFRALLGEAHEYANWPVLDGVLPDDPAQCDGWIVTGSAAGAYDDLPWIAGLTRFLQEARGRTRLVGICFGHQIMAQAFGGRVEKSARGWGLGLHEYAVRERVPWMDGAATFAVPVSHQDQVVAPPPGARVVAASDFTPIAALAYDDGSAISFQCHPEFTPSFAAELVALRRPEEFDDVRRAAALASLQRPNDNARLGGWINRFLGERG